MASVTLMLFSARNWSRPRSTSGTRQETGAGVSLDERLFAFVAGVGHLEQTTPVVGFMTTASLPKRILLPGT